MELIAATGIVRRYGGRAVVDGADLTVRDGEVLAILGPNGAGKSTLFRILLLLEAADAGTIRVDGVPARAGDTDLMRRMAAVFQRPYLYDGTVRDNVGYGLRARGVGAGERASGVSAALRLLELEHVADAHVRTLSGGEAQRTGLARALVLKPDLLALDEPTLNLDVTARRRFRETVADVMRTHARGAVLITHDPADAFALADRIAVMEHGRIVQTGTPAELVLEPGTAFVAEFTGAELLLRGTVMDRDGELVHVRLAGGSAVWAVAGGSAMDVDSRVSVAYRPEDVTLAAGGNETSAVNRFDAVVDAVIPAGALVRVRLSGDVPLAALITARSMAALGLAKGTHVTAHLKATALRAFPAGG